MGTISNLFNSIPGTKKDWKEDWKETSKQDWKFDWDSASGGVMPAPANTAIPTFSAGTAVGTVFTATNGTWTGEGITFTYQWSVNGVGISGATSSSFDTTGLSVGDVVRVKVYAVNGGGAADRSSTGRTLT